MKYTTTSLVFIALAAVCCNQESSTSPFEKAAQAYDRGYKIVECKAGEMRCNRDIVERCNFSGRWKPSRDCGAILKKCYDSPEYCGGYIGHACCR